MSYTVKEVHWKHISNLGTATKLPLELFKYKPNLSFARPWWSTEFCDSKARHSSSNELVNGFAECCNASNRNLLLEKKRKGLSLKMENFNNNIMCHDILQEAANLPDI